jgi:Ulp1 protease family, C-terminal catalytic domain
VLVSTLSLLGYSQFVSTIQFDPPHRLTRRKEDIENSDVHIFTSHFYSTLRDEGSTSVQSWTKKKNIDIFKKKMVFIPINESWHWSLCVLVNPGAVENPSVEPRDKYPCMIFVDSLRMHDSDHVKQNIYKWLNREWCRLNVDKGVARASSHYKRPPNVFNHDSFPCHSPKGRSYHVSDSLLAMQFGYGFHRYSVTSHIYFPLIFCS